MAEHLARIIGTEEDRVNCPFYWKIGACRHGDQCSRSHYKPTNSPTVIIRHMYENSPISLAIAEGQVVDDKLADNESDRFEEFYEEIFEELAKYGEISDLLVCDNIGDHMIGNVYVRYTNEEYAKSALDKLKGRSYSGKLIDAELSPVSDFKEARCRQFIDGCCNRGGYCNFMHIKHIPRCVKNKIFQQMYRDHPEYSKKNKSDRYSDYRHDDLKRELLDDGRYDYTKHTKYIRQSSEERRQMIEMWNKQRNINNH
ncbi:U2 SNRNP auxiliary factor small subunit [Cryptosporidium andersoni]|uniref:U2 SNRNP auxiliary factor small subunit n=1 Tax=Cryptosporidium andersoni TaxID=117008 RepID=A0A1J4MT61_9CRYT|nr:U2 SNRNP auxiliary factor small subunit [Cryptosporidium andersoni]